jgi:hypothetical protein
MKDQIMNKVKANNWTVGELLANLTPEELSYLFASMNMEEN